MFESVPHPPNMKVMMVIFYNALTRETYQISEYWVTWELPLTSSVWFVPGTF